MAERATLGRGYEERASATVYLPPPGIRTISDEERARMVRDGLLCCELAEVLGCVCMLAFRCPVHCPHERHIGTHD
jgi:hypothetical protein